jgi:hypothetical protein
MRAALHNVRAIFDSRKYGVAGLAGHAIAPRPDRGKYRAAPSRVDDGK